MENTTTPGTALVVVPGTGQVLDLEADAVDTLADAADTIAQMRGELTDTENAVLSELVNRLDKMGKWTHRVRVERGDQAVDLEIKAASPDAGTTSYDAPLLEALLRQHVAADELDPVAADAALERTVTVTFRVPITADSLDAVKDAVEGATEVTIGGQRVEIGAVNAQRKVRAAGMNALAKIPAAKATVDAVTVETPPPARKASVKIKTRER